MVTKNIYYSFPFHLSTWSRCRDEWIKLLRGKVSTESLTSWREITKWSVEDKNDPTSLIIREQSNKTSYSETGRNTCGTFKSISRQILLYFCTYRTLTSSVVTYWWNVHHFIEFVHNSQMFSPVWIQLSLLSGSTGLLKTSKSYWNKHSLFCLPWWSKIL